MFDTKNKNVVSLLCLRMYSGGILYSCIKNTWIGKMRKQEPYPLHLNGTSLLNIPDS